MLESKLRELEDLRQNWDTPEMKIASISQTWTWRMDNYLAPVRANNAFNNLNEFRVLPCMYV